MTAPLVSLVANAQIAGAASVLRSRWPRGITDGGDATAVDKFGTADVNNYSITAYAGGTQQTLVVNGVAAVDFKATATPTGFGVAYSRRLSWFTERSGGKLYDGWTCWSFRATLQFDNPPGVITGDCGIVLACGNNNSVNGDGISTNPGVIFGPNNADNITLRARRVNGGAQTVTDVVAAALTPTLTKFNTYDLRIVSGSASSDPVLYGLINGVVVTPRIPWTAAAALLPPPNAVAGNFGYTLAAINRGGGGVPNMYVHELLLTAAQSEADLD